MALVDIRRFSVQRSVGWGVLFSEMLLFVSLSALLGVLVWRVPAGRADLGFVCAVAMALHSVAFVRLVVRAQRFLDLECPDCEQNFHGYPDRLPVPFRAHCHHCGASSTPR